MSSLAVRASLFWLYRWNGPITSTIIRSYRHVHLDATEQIEHPSRKISYAEKRLSLGRKNRDDRVVAGPNELLVTRPTETPRWHPHAPINFNRRGQTLKFAQKVETSPWKHCSNCTQPALTIASDHLIELVDRGNRAPSPPGQIEIPAASYSPGSVAIWCGRALNRPSQKI